MISNKELFDIFNFWFSKTIYTNKLMFSQNHESIESAFDDFFLDYIRYFEKEKTVSIDNLTISPQLQVLLCYRVARRFYLEKKEDLAILFSLLGRHLSGTEIYYSSKIGNGLRINHGVGTVIGARVVLGDNCLIHQGVTLGDRNGLRPIIGNHVTIYANASILGGINIGNHSVIGANSVCLADVPENGIVAGVPGRIIRIK